MASFRPGVGDPLSSLNPFSDGRPNWRLQGKTRACKPPDMLGTGLQVDAPKISPYTSEFSDLYKINQKASEIAVKRQMRHFDHHLAQTTNEIPLGGLHVPEHLISGEDNIRPPGGRKFLNQAVKFNPKDGGVWEPKRREYPELSRRSSNSGVKIVGKPQRTERPVDIWPADLTVRDQFKPGGLKIFQNKRSTNTEAFPGAIGYNPPLLHDEEGQMVDYSSVKMGGIFGRKRLHGNEPLKLNEDTSATFFPDRTALTRSKKLESAHSNIANTETAFPFRPQLPHAAKRRASPAKVEKQEAKVVQGQQMQPPLREKAIVVPPPPSTYSQQVKQSQSDVKKFSPRETLKHEFPLAPTTSWTFVGGYRP